MIDLYKAWMDMSEREAEWYDYFTLVLGSLLLVLGPLVVFIYAIHTFGWVIALIPIVLLIGTVFTLSYKKAVRLLEREKELWNDAD